jgi:RAQPRD family integrative conjugative element protein
MPAIWPNKHTAKAVKTMSAAVLLTVVTVAALPARADDDLEREQLARIANELQNVEAMADQAQRAVQTGQPAAQVRFRYDWLKRDLQMMRQSIEQHVDAPRQPRPVPPLRGDYRY